MTNVKDLGFWLNAQLGIGDIPDKLKRAINRSHEVNKETAGYEDTNNYYSYGWSNDIEAKVINHNASNPNYSAQVIIDLEKQEAIFVLANLNSSVPTQIAYNIYEHMNGKQMSRFSYDDFNILLDLIFSILTIIALVSLCIKIINLTKQKKQTIKNENTRSYKMGRLIIGLVLRIILLVLIIIWPYLLNYNYHFIRVWMPNAILAWEFLAVINCVLSIITKLRKIVVIRKKNVFIEGSTGTLNEN